MFRAIRGRDFDTGRLWMTLVLLFSVVSQCTALVLSGFPGFPGFPRLPGQSATLPQTCLQPSGIDCNWYQDCLALKYPCRGGDEYAISYGEKFCELSQSYRFSPQGMAWVSAVKRCLQVNLAPVLQANPALPCQTVTQQAFAKYSPCYLRPPGAGSVCDLSCADVNQVLSIMREVLKPSPLESVRGAWQVLGGCTTTLVRCNLQVIPAWPYIVPKAAK